MSVIYGLHYHHRTVHTVLMVICNVIGLKMKCSCNCIINFFHVHDQSIIGLILFCYTSYILTSYSVPACIMCPAQNRGSGHKTNPHQPRVCQLGVALLKHNSIALYSTLCMYIYFSVHSNCSCIFCKLSCQGICSCDQHSMKQSFF